jgi:hypothetical protein
MQVDTVLMRPCLKFPLMCRLLPTYLLSDNSPEGHAVVLMKVGGVKDLCDAIFQTPEGARARTFYDRRLNHPSYSVHSRHM